MLFNTLSSNTWDRIIYSENLKLAYVLKLHYRFREYKQKSPGFIAIGILFSQILEITENLGVVQANISFLIGLSLLNTCELHVSNLKNVLCCLELTLNILHERRHRHIILHRMTKARFYIVHRIFSGYIKRFSHPVFDKPYYSNLLKLPRPGKTPK